VQLTGAHAEERERRLVERILLDLERVVAVALRPPESNARREQKLLPRVRPDRIAEAGFVLPATQPIGCGLLALRPPDRELRGGFQIVVDDRPVADGRSENAVPALSEGTDEGFKRFGLDDACLAGVQVTSLRRASLLTGPPYIGVPTDPKVVIRRFERWRRAPTRMYFSVFP
jgi:hypothetical protein